MPDSYALKESDPRGNEKMIWLHDEFHAASMNYDTTFKLIEIKL